MKKKTLYTVLSVPAVLIAFLCVLFLLILPGLRPFTVLLYGLSETEISSYAELIPKNAKILELPASENPTERQLKDADLVFASRNAYISSHQALFAPLSSAEIAVVPPSLRKAVQNGTGYTGLPLQLDHFELAWDYAKFEKLALQPPKNSEALQKALEKHPSGIEPALLIAGGNGDMLLAFVSVLYIAENGYASYIEVQQALLEGKKLSHFENTALNRTIQKLAEWDRKGYLHPEWLKMQDADVKYYMEQGYGFMVFGSLAFHRTIDYQTIYQYESSSFPGLFALSEPTLAAPMTILYAKPREKYLQLARNLTAQLSSPETGHTLAQKTGKSTTISAARAPDVQAADVLSWAAASTHIVNGLYRDAFTATSAADAFAEEVRLEIQHLK